MLTLTDIRKTFNAGTINEKKALNGVTIDLDDGDFVTIIGGNGAGKSTTQSRVYGLLTAVLSSLTGETLRDFPNTSERSLSGAYSRTR